MTGISKHVDLVTQTQNNDITFVYLTCQNESEKKKKVSHLLLNSVLLGDYGLVVREAVHSCKRKETHSIGLSVRY